MSHSALQIIKDGDIIVSVGTPEEVTVALASARPGRYVIEESSMAGELLPGGYSRQRWGVAIRQADGSVMIEPEPAPAKR
jgi:hypothetical protein